MNRVKLALYMKLAP